MGVGQPEYVRITLNTEQGTRAYPSTLTYRGDTVRVPALYERRPLDDADPSSLSAYPARIAGILWILGLQLAADWRVALRAGDGYWELPVVPTTSASPTEVERV